MMMMVVNDDDDGDGDGDGDGDDPIVHDSEQIQDADGVHMLVKGIALTSEEKLVTHKDHGFEASYSRSCLFVDVDVDLEVEGMSHEQT